MFLEQNRNNVNGMLAVAHTVRTAKGRLIAFVQQTVASHAADVCAAMSCASTVELTSRRSTGRASPPVRVRAIIERQVFIVGMPRSGRTLVEQILDAHGDCHGAGERSALMRAFATRGGGNGALPVARHR
jgi:hypothetical protein